MSNLVLTRGVEEVICIKTPEGRRIDVRVNKVWGNRVSLSVMADPEVRIIREEIADASTD